MAMGLLVAVAALYVAPAARADVTTMVEAGVAAAGVAGLARVPCPEGAITVGGGLDPANVLSMLITSTAPAFGTGDTDRLIFQSNGSQEAGVAWQATTRNEEAFAQSFKIAAVCATGIEAFTEVVSANAPGGSVTSVSVVCPEGSVAIGGGVDVSNIGLMKVTSQAPLFGPGPPESLATRPDGANPAPSGWSATVRNTGGAQAIAVAAICSSGTNVVTEVGTMPLPVASFGNERLFCPEGFEAASGGFLPADTTNVVLTSNAPAFGADPFDLLFAQPEGENPAPVAWQWNARNDTAGTLSSKVAVVCVPEPGSLASMLVAAATLGGVSARRRSRRAAAGRRNRAASPTSCS